MDQRVYDEASKLLDEKFEQKYPQFVAWFKTHPDYRQEIKPRIAHNCQCYQDEYLAAKEVGLI